MAAPLIDTSGGVTFAQFIGKGSTGIVGLLNTIVVPLIFAAAVAVFIWGVVQYLVLSQGNETKLAEGRQFILWGLLGMVVILAVWGIVSLLISTLGFGA